MPDFRRYRVPAGCYFFTANLLERRGNTLLTDRVDLLREAVRRVRRSRPFTIDAWVVPRSYARRLDVAARRRRLLDPLASNQNLLRACPAENGMALPRPSRRRRTRHLATPLLGACHPRRRGLRNAYGLRSLQPGQARLGGLSGGVAVLHVQVVRPTRSLSPRLDGQRHSGCPGRRTRRMKHSSEYARGYSDEGFYADARNCSTVRPASRTIPPRVNVFTGL